MNFLDIAKKAIKYTSPVAYGADVLKDRYQSNNLGAITNVKQALQTNQNYGVQNLDPGIQLPVTAVLGATTDSNSNQNIYSPTGGSVGAAPNYKQSVLDKIHAIQSAYDAMSGGIDQTVNDRVNQYQNDYGKQFNDLNNQYGKAQDQISSVYSARGLGDSSFLANEQDNANKTYQDNVNSINQNKAQTLGQLGQFGATQKASVGAGRGQYDQILQNIDQYSPTDLANLDSTLGSSLSNLQTQQAGLGTNQGFLDSLAQIAPQVNNGASQLASQLQKLATSSVPGLAKKQIAQGLITQAQINDPNAQKYWQNFYQSLLTDPNKLTVGA